MEFPNPHKFIIKQGTLIRFPKYIYENGGNPTDKYLIILHCDESNETYTSFSFTTTQLHKYNVPTTYQIHKFCSCDLTVPTNVDYFFFQKETPVGVDDYCFKENCIVAFQNNIHEKPMSFFEEKSIGNKSDELNFLTTLTNETMKDLLSCLIKSDHITIPQEKKLKKSLETL